MTHASDEASGGVGHWQDGPTASRPTYYLIQVLRAVGALMVVGHHASELLFDRLKLPLNVWIPGSAGVDIFFVISGFVMTISSGPLRRTKHPARTFLARRLERIVPLYWLLTILKIAVALALPALAANVLGSTWHVVASFLFLPAAAADGSYQPVILVGWTLNFEMMFYLLFAAVLALRARLLPMMGPILVVIAFLHLLPQPGVPAAFGWFESTLLLEFLGGIILAENVAAIKRLPVAWGMLLMAAGFIALEMMDWPVSSYWRGLGWGPPAVAVVCGALILENGWGKRMPRWPLLLGDASYSIYLAHTLVLPLIGVVLKRMGTHWSGFVPFAIVASIVLSAGAGVIVYRFLERPITQWFKGRRKTAVPAVA